MLPFWMNPEKKDKGVSPCGYSCEDCHEIVAGSVAEVGDGK